MMICRFRKLWIIHHASSVAIPAGRCIKIDDRHEDQGTAICIACICTRVVRVTSKSIDFLPIYTKLCAIMEPINSTTTLLQIKHNMYIVYISMTTTRWSRYRKHYGKRPVCRVSKLLPCANFWARGKLIFLLCCRTKNAR